MKKAIRAYMAGFLTCLLLSATLVWANTGIMRELFYGVRVVVDGDLQHFDYDMRPFIIGGRTFLPVRALGDVIGVETDWDPVNLTVYISTRAPQPMPTPQPIPQPDPIPTPMPTPPPTVGVQPGVLTVTTATPTIRLGEEITVQVVTNMATTHVRLVDVRNRILAESTTFNDVGTSRTFNITYRPERGESTAHMIRALPGDATQAFRHDAESIRTLHITVEEGTTAPPSGPGTTPGSGANLPAASVNARYVIHSVNVARDEVPIGEYSDVTVVTQNLVGRAVSRLDIVDWRGNVLQSVTEHTEANNRRTWTFRVRAENSGTNSFNVRAFLDDGARATDIAASIVGTRAGGERARITDHRISRNTINRDESITITVYTNNAVRRVWLECPDRRGRRQNATTSFTEVGNDRRRWTMVFYPMATGRHYIFAEEIDTQEEISQQFNITIN